ncbi:hypothetical protein B0H14DRAFT_3129712, partial [Mycena olivaceomarginata]
PVIGPRRPPLSSWWAAPSRHSDRPRELRPPTLAPLRTCHPHPSFHWHHLRRLPSCSPLTVCVVWDSTALPSLSRPIALSALWSPLVVPIPILPLTKILARSWKLKIVGDSENGGVSGQAEDVGVQR